LLASREQRIIGEIQDAMRKAIEQRGGRHYKDSVDAFRVLCRRLVTDLSTGYFAAYVKMFASVQME
jgi:hypothetical protein